MRHRQLPAIESVDIFLDESLLFVTPDFPALRKALDFTAKKMDAPADKPWLRKSVPYTVHPYNEAHRDNVKGLHTYAGFWSKIIDFCNTAGLKYRIFDARPVFMQPRLDLMHGFRFRQRELLVEALMKDCSGLIGAPTRYGKCLAPGTLVMMADGSSTPVEAIQNGDEVMSPAGNASRVIGVTSGKAHAMFRITPKDGGVTWACNDDHILVLFERDAPGGAAKTRTMRAEEYYHKVVMGGDPALKMARASRSSFGFMEFSEFEFDIALAPELADYAGFEIDGPDKMFLLADGTITHNTALIFNTLRAFPEARSALIIPGADLLKQTKDDMVKALPGREISAIGTGMRTKFQSKDITICSMDSMHKLDHNDTRLVLVDEPHMLVTDARLEDFMKFTRARKYGYGATLDARYDKRDPLIVGAIGPVLANRTFLEAVEEGAVCQIVIIMPQIEVTYEMAKRIGGRDAAYNALLRRSPQIKKLIHWLSGELIPADMQTLTFIQDEAQAEFLADGMPGNPVVAMAKLLNKKNRNDLLADMKSSTVKRAISSNIYSTGVTFSDLAVVINAAGGGGSNLAIQKPGRLAEVRPGKKFGVMIDPMFVPAANLDDYHRDEVYKSGCGVVMRDCVARREAYQNRGYILMPVKGYKSLAEVFKNCF